MQLSYGVAQDFQEPQGQKLDFQHVQFPCVSCAICNEDTILTQGRAAVRLLQDTEGVSTAIVRFSAHIFGPGMPQDCCMIIVQ